MNVVFVFVFAQIFQIIICSNLHDREKEILDHILSPDRYDMRIRPRGTNGTDNSPVIVRVNFFIRSIYDVDDEKMEYKVQLTFRQQWLDSRLKYDSNGSVKYLTLTNSNQIWEPDLFFTNENEGRYHVMMKPNLYYRIFPDGSVLYSRRLSLTLGCSMNLKSYPFDKQTCLMRMASYAYTTNDIVFLWKEGDPVQVVKNLHLAKFTIERFGVDYCNSKTNTGEYSCISADFNLKREFFYYLIQIYLPSAMMVLISFTSFWFNPTAIQSRMFLGISTLFVLAIQTSVVNASIPQVSYTKSVDIWTGVCLTFVFAAFLEFCTVHYVYRSKFYNPVGKKPEDGDLLHSEIGADNDCDNAFTMKSLNQIGEYTTPENKCTIREQIRNLNCCHFWFKRFSTNARAIDVLSRILFPVCFLLFNFVYWLCIAI